MRPFRWRSNKSTTPAQPVDPLAVPPVDPLATAGSGSRIDWKRAVPRLLAVLVIAAAIVLGVLWAAGAFKNDHRSTVGKARPFPQTAQNTTSGHGKPTPAAAPSTPAPAQTPGASGQSPTAAPNQPAPGSPNNPGSGQLTNTGPGETLAVFAVATVAGTALYQINLRRRLS